jgi:hypothetical protein
MLDHVFLDTVGVMRQALDDTLLCRAAHEDRLSSDLLLGDLVWETSVSLPGEADPPQVRADISLDWPTWSQTAWRTLAMGEASDEPPEIGIEIVFRVQGLAQRPALAAVLDVLPVETTALGTDPLERSGPVVEESFEDAAGPSEIAVEVAYEGSFRLTPEPAPRRSSGLPDLDRPPPRAATPSSLDLPATAAQPVGAAPRASLVALVGWIASTLVRLADLPLDFLPPTSD